MGANSLLIEGKIKVLSSFNDEYNQVELDVKSAGGSIFALISKKYDIAEGETIRVVGTLKTGGVVVGQFVETRKVS